MTSSPIKEYNLRYLKKSRLKSGDIFVMQIGGEYLFGRIIRDNLSFEESPFGGSNLIYLYDIRASSKIIDYSRLTPDHLLIPPLYVSNVLWSRGYAVKVAHFDISEKDLLQRHCFYSSTHKHETYFDEKGAKLAKRTEPCGEWIYVIGLGYIDNKISDALGIKRAPLTQDDLSYISGRGEKIWLTRPLSELKKHVNYEEIVKKYPEVIKQ